MSRAIDHKCNSESEDGEGKKIRTILNKDEGKATLYGLPTKTCTNTSIKCTKKKKKQAGFPILFEREKPQIARYAIDYYECNSESGDGKN